MFNFGNESNFKWMNMQQFSCCYYYYYYYFISHSAHCLKKTTLFYQSLQRFSWRIF
jgi:hypothetical protein